MTDEGLVYIGKIISLEPIEGADLIVSATVVCGKGGKWRGVVGLKQFQVGSLCTVYLPDSIIPPNESMKFMEKHKWRVKMCRFKGSPSEVVITPVYFDKVAGAVIGWDITQICGVVKYYKPVPANLQGKMKGAFPTFIPKTDEPNYQRVPEMIDMLRNHAYYVTEKADGSSTTAFKLQGYFGICSRNWELQRDENNGYWKVAMKYDLENKLPEGIALQWETCGPKIQNNPMGLQSIDGFAFSAYNIDERKYLDAAEFTTLCYELGFPTVKILDSGPSFEFDKAYKLAEGNYDNGKLREGIVVRSVLNLDNGKPLSFKVINLNYET